MSYINDALKKAQQERDSRYERFGGIIELVGGLAVMLGFYTRPAAFLCSGMMAVAYFQFHWKFQIGPEFFPLVNKGELAVLYCFVFLLIACRGGVKWSLDRMR